MRGHMLLRSLSVGKPEAAACFRRSGLPGLQQAESEQDGGWGVGGGVEGVGEMQQTLWSELCHMLDCVRVLFCFRPLLESATVTDT